MTSDYNCIVYYPSRKLWRAFGRHRHKTIYLGYFRSETVAAAAADLCRYILYGPDPANWHHNATKPNFMPRVRKECASGRWGDSLVRHLLDKGLISAELARIRLAEYDRIASEVAKTSAL